MYEDSFYGMSSVYEDFSSPDINTLLKENSGGINTVAWSLLVSIFSFLCIKYNEI